MKDVLEKIKIFVKTHKIVCIACCAVLVIGIVIIFPPAFGNDKETTLEERLSGFLEEMGKDFYENYYYDAVGSSDESRKNFLQKYSEIGIKVNLDNLSRYNGESVEERIESFKNNESGEDCNRENTKVIIYPQDPYGKTDYRLETILECGLD